MLTIWKSNKLSIDSVFTIIKKLPMLIFSTFRSLWYAKVLKFIRLVGWGSPGTCFKKIFDSSKFFYYNLYSIYIGILIQTIQP